jgi:hypothetical protein
MGPSLAQLAKPASVLFPFVSCRQNFKFEFNSNLFWFLSQVSKQGHVIHVSGVV